VVTKKSAGDEGEARAWTHLQRHGLALVQRNYRVALGARVPGGEVDLIVREPDGTLVFVEVRARRRGGLVGAAASITGAKRRSIVLAARHYLQRFATPPPCRFDVVAIDGESIEWLKAAFDVE
jgi:putative endonuclease